MQTLLFIATLVSSVFGIHAPVAPVQEPQLVPLYVTVSEVKQIVNESISKTQKPQILGAAPSPAALSTYTLAGSGVSSSATSLTLTSLTIKQTGQKIVTADLVQGASDYFYITLEPGNITRQEIVGCTTVTQNANLTATLSGCSRGLSPIYPYTASSTLRFTHAGSSQVIFGDAPQIFNDFNNYVASAVVSGAVDSSATVKGLVEKATVAEAAGHAAVGSGNTTAPLALTADIASSTRTTTDQNVIVASSTGYIDYTYIRSTNVFPGVSFTSASTTFATSSINIGSFPAYSIGKNIQVITTTGTSTFSVPSGVTKVNVKLVGAGGGGNSGSGANVGGGGGGGGGYSEEMVDVSGTSTIQVYIGVGGGANENGGPTKFGTNGFYLSATGGSFGTTGAAGGNGGVGSNGDLNIQGQGGGGATSATSGSNGGPGGNSMLGGGGAGVADGTGKNGGNYGGGASGAANGVVAGTGAQGVIIVTW